MIFALGSLRLTQYSLLSSIYRPCYSLFFSCSSRDNMSQKKKICIVGSGNWYFLILIDYSYYLSWLYCEKKWNWILVFNMFIKKSRWNISKQWVVCLLQNIKIDTKFRKPIAWRWPLAYIFTISFSFFTTPKES